QLTPDNRKPAPRRERASILKKRFTRGWRRAVNRSEEHTQKCVHQKMGATIPMDGQMASLGVPACGVSPLESAGAPARYAPDRAAPATLDLGPVVPPPASVQPAGLQVVVDP